MKLSFLSAIFIIFCLTACQYGHRKPSSTTNGINLHKETELILSEIQDQNKFNLDNCPAFLKPIYEDVFKLNPSRFDYSHTQQNWKIIYKNLWQIRVQLQERLHDFSSQASATDPKMTACVLAMRDSFRLSRWLEDYLTEIFSGEPQDYKAAEPKNQHNPRFKPTPFRGESPWLQVNPKFKKVTIRSGDVIISRGNAYASSAIARIGEVDSQFSHISFVYIEGDGKGQEYTIEEALENPRILILESHIEVGSTIRPIKLYFEDKNARNVIFRYQDALIAHRSARWVHDYIQGYRKRSFDSNPLDDKDDVNHNVPYNFQMSLDNPHNPKKLFCSQLVHVGFNSNNIKVPYISSVLNTQLSLPKRLGITTTSIFAPGDIELDPRFEMVAEYRNLRKLKSIRIKDIILSGMYRMMGNGYEFYPPLLIGTKSLIAWVLRQMDAALVKNQLPKNMNTKVLNTMFTLEKVAMYFEKEFEKYDNTNSTPYLPLSFNQGLEIIEKLRAQDQELYVTRKAPKFHWSFRSPSLEQTPEPDTSD